MRNDVERLLQARGRFALAGLVARSNSCGMTDYASDCRNEQQRESLTSRNAVWSLRCTMVRWEDHASLIPMDPVLSRRV